MAKTKKSKPDFSKPKPVKKENEFLEYGHTPETEVQDTAAETDNVGEGEMPENGDEFGQKDENATEELTFFKEKSYILYIIIQSNTISRSNV